MEFQSERLAVFKKQK